MTDTTQAAEPVAAWPTDDEIEAIRAEIEALDPVGLQALRNTIHARCGGTFEKLDVLDVHRIYLIGRKVRGANGAPAVGKRSSTSSKTSKRSSADDLLQGF